MILISSLVYLPFTFSLSFIAVQIQRKFFLLVLFSKLILCKEQKTKEHRKGFILKYPLNVSYINNFQSNFIQDFLISFYIL